MPARHGDYQIIDWMRNNLIDIVSYYSII